MSVRLIPAPISVTFSQENEDKEGFEREYHSLSGADDDPIGQWLKLAKAKGDTQETDKVLLQLMIEMHRKIDHLERLIKDEAPERLALKSDTMIAQIGFEMFELQEPMFIKGTIYYGRLNMPVYPQREVAVFFEALDEKQGKIIRIHERDQIEWNAYVTARERVMIREMKGRS